MPAVLAHQGGWDELIFVLIPIASFAGLLALANKRAGQTMSRRDSDDNADADDGD